MSAEARLPETAPIMVAFRKYKQTDEFRNSANWALDAKHTEGSLWAAFVQGWLAAGGKLEE